ncbi:MAG TPA: bifunctional oligoribonuclease/PAP phosphatase NrnA, partial [Spirochaetota bacterium]|nr:bifunctional oligoribonuclease/PAP phosphatase NrnA [Spirochaetota bacterium]
MPDLHVLEEYLSRHDRFIISTHESPDGDGLGAEIAFRELLLHLGKEAIILNSDATPEKFLFVDQENEVNVFSKGCEIPDNLAEYAVFVLDTNDFENIGSVHPIIKDLDLLIIDHHEVNESRGSSRGHYIAVDASSTSEIIYTLMRHFGAEPSRKAAQAIYTGILYDTGSFRYPKTSPATFRAIADLVERGANPFNIYEQVYENNSLASFELRALMLASMEKYFDGRLILMRLTPEMLKESGASFSEGELNINLPHTVKGVVASILVKQDIGGPIKVSMRTKGDYDVAKIAMANGGGGHKNAAGYKSKL